MKIRKGYKVLDMDMRPIYGDRSMKYEIGEMYCMDRFDLFLDISGFHYFTKLEFIDCDKFSLDTTKNRIFEIDIIGVEKKDRLLEYGCASRIRLVRELSTEDIVTYLNNKYGDIFSETTPDHIRSKLSSSGLFLDHFIHDTNENVKMNVLKNEGYGADILSRDRSPNVRRTVAFYGFCLDFLSKDPDRYVRLEVAKHGCNNDQFLYDQCPRIREELARQGYRLDILINDDNVRVRSAVLDHMYNLDRFLEDPNLPLRTMAAHLMDLQSRENDDPWFVPSNIPNKSEIQLNIA